MTARWMIGRVYCPECDIVRPVVWDAEVTEIRCPACDTLTLRACGDEEGTLSLSFQKSLTARK
jgi:ribosomal protein S27E